MCCFKVCWLNTFVGEILHVKLCPYSPGEKEQWNAHSENRAKDWWLENTLYHICNVAAAEHRREGKTKRNKAGTQKWRWSTAGLWSTRGTFGGGAGATTWPRTTETQKNTKLWMVEKCQHPKRKRKICFFPLVSGSCEYFIVFGLLCAYIVLCIILLLPNSSHFSKRDNNIIVVVKLFYSVWFLVFCIQYIPRQI